MKTFLGHLGEILVALGILACLLDDYMGKNHFWTTGFLAFYSAILLIVSIDQRRSLKTVSKDIARFWAVREYVDRIEKGDAEYKIDICPDCRQKFVRICKPLEDSCPCHVGKKPEAKLVPTDESIIVL